MNTKQTSCDAKFKMQVVLESFQKEILLSALAQKYNISTESIQKWKQEFLNNVHLAFEKLPSKNMANDLQEKNKELKDKLQKIQIEKKALSAQLHSLDLSTKKELIEQIPTDLSIAKQCKLLNINRPTLYYKPKSKEQKNLSIIKAIQDIQLNSKKNLGYRKIYTQLKEQGIKIGINQVHQLLQHLASKENTLR